MLLVAQWRTVQVPCSLRLQWCLPSCHPINKWVYFLKERKGGLPLCETDVTERWHSQAMTPQSCIIYRDWGGGGAGNDDMCVRVCVGGVVLSRHQLLRQPSARRRTIHSIMTCNLDTLSTLRIYLFVGVVSLFFDTISGFRDKQPPKTWAERENRYKERNSWKKKCSRKSWSSARKSD